MANIAINSSTPSDIQFLGAGQTMFAGTPVIIQGPASAGRGLDRQQQSSMKALSIVQLICGALSIIFDVCLLLTTNRFALASGMWCGLIFLITGILGVVGAARNRQCVLIATMVMSILSSIALFVVVGFNGDMIYNCSRKIRMYPYYGSYSEEFAFGSLLIVNSAVELIVSICASVLCCKGVCRVNNQLGTPYTTQPAYYIAQQSLGNQVTAQAPTGIAVTQSQAIVSAVHLNEEQAIRPQRQLATGNTNYVAGTAGLPVHST